MANPPLFNAVSSSARQLLLLLRCLPPSSKAHVRLSPEGLRISTEEGSALEAFVFVEKALFASYTYNTAGGEGVEHEAPIFQVNLNALIETLNIFTLSDMPAPKQSATTEAYAAHRLNRHAGINAFSSSAFGMNGICTLTYEYEGAPLSVHMSDAGVATTCDLTTYSAMTVEDIPFSRDAIALKTIMRSSFMLDAMTELSSLNPAYLTLMASPARSGHSGLSLSVSGGLGSANVDFVADTLAEEPIIETFTCPNKITASFRFALVRSAQRAMSTASKLSLRLDEDGVLSMQFLVELEGHGAGSGVAFIDFKVVPLVEGEADGESSADEAV
ncbi:hypothetical protein AMS68_002550 [Peltaster fructicola]|uniref:DNA repair exonuclease rad1 n=1 Tax=Peltaster fructicola TaxID=286661 RepID=A0A6H0XQQ1_9PEZI|nr:hypothetical protein AMS68_002550 [Peltaster fructicola]